MCRSLGRVWLFYLIESLYSKTFCRRSVTKQSHSVGVRHTSISASGVFIGAVEVVPPHAEPIVGRGTFASFRRAGGAAATRVRQRAHAVHEAYAAVSSRREELECLCTPTSALFSTASERSYSSSCLKLLLSHRAPPPTCHPSSASSVTLEFVSQRLCVGL